MATKLPPSPDPSSAPKPDERAKRAASWVNADALEPATLVERLPTSAIPASPTIADADPDVTGSDITASDTLPAGARRPMADPDGMFGHQEENEGSAALTAIDVAVAAGLAPEPVARAVSLPAQDASRSVADPAEARPALPADLGLVAEQLAAHVGEPVAPSPARTGFGRWRVRTSTDGSPRSRRDLWIAGVLALVLVGYLAVDTRMTELILGEDVVINEPRETVPMSWKDIPVPKVDPIPEPTEPPPHQPLPETPFVAPKRPDPSPVPNAYYVDESYSNGRNDRAKKTGKNAKRYTHEIRRGTADEPSGEEKTGAHATGTVPKNSEPTKAPTETKPAATNETKPATNGAVASTAAKTGSAMLTIVSQPAGATIELDGEVIGKTPLIRPAPKGKTTFTVRLLLEGKKPWTGTLTANEAGHFALNVAL